MVSVKEVERLLRGRESGRDGDRKAADGKRGHREHNYFDTKTYRRVSLLKVARIDGARSIVGVIRFGAAQ